MSAEKPPPRRIPRKPAPMEPEKREQIQAGLQKVIGKARSRKNGDIGSLPPDGPSPQRVATPTVALPETGHIRPTITIGSDGHVVVQAAKIGRAHV